MWTFHLKNCFGIILINMGSHKFNNRHARNALEIGNLFLDSKSKEFFHVIIKELK
jgi:hypothetical protein